MKKILFLITAVSIFLSADSVNTNKEEKKKKDPNIGYYHGEKEKKYDDYIYQETYWYEKEDIKKQPEDLGTYGKLYDIKEPNMWYKIKDSFAKVDMNKIQKKLEEARKRALIVKNNIPYCSSNNYRTYKPLYTVPETIIFEGKVIAKKGDVVNPLEHNHMKSPILIIDIDNPEHIKYKKEMEKKYKNNILILAGKGDIGKYYQENNELVYKVPAVFTDKIKINCLPTLVKQDNDEFEINEILLENKQKVQNNEK